MTEINLPKFGSTKSCPACGCSEFIRKFSCADFHATRISFDGLGFDAIKAIKVDSMDKICAICTVCGWSDYERMLSQSSEAS